MSRKKFNDPMAILDQSPVTKAERETPAFGVERPQLPQLRTIPIIGLEPDPEQPRRQFDEERLRELADDLIQNGMRNPIRVRQMTTLTFRIIDGERRFRAAKIAEMGEVPALVYTDLTEKDVDETQLAEIFHREDYNPVDKAYFIQGYKDYHQLTWDQVADRLKVSVQRIFATIAVLTAPASIKERIAEGSLTLGHYTELKSLPLEVQEPLAERAVQEGLSVRGLRDQKAEYQREIEDALSNPPTLDDESSSAEESEDGRFNPPTLDDESSSEIVEPVRLLHRPPAPVETLGEYRATKLTVQVDAALHSRVRAKMHTLGLTQCADYLRYLLHQDLDDPLEEQESVDIKNTGKL
jgi:ParB/RepB/Spo0J family partition protein